ncbi:MAG TPA: peptide ABC transporter substrate-binding protein [Gemmatimonadaceae bacterium]|jgi:peptide/nickel transport system substrate-binding protein|nr:peptide ABC transporter substrate-binding protein [Gemmatimonadaceae bacterium]
MRSPLRSILAALLVASVACGGEPPSPGDDSATGGSLLVAIQTDVGAVIPPAIRQVDQKLVADQVFEPLAWMGDEGRVDSGFRPALADGWTWEADSTVLSFRLNPAARWHDGKPVRASDVRFTFAMYTDPEVGSVERQALLRIDSVTVRDSLTPVFWFGARYPEQLFDAAARMLIIPEHHLGSAPRATLQTAAFGRSPIGTGRFRVAKWEPTTSIELVADTTHYRGRARLDRVIFAHTPDANAMAARLASGELDAGEVVNSDHFKTLSAKPDLRAHVLPALDYAYVQFNFRDPGQPNRPHPLFADAGMRRALTLALDRSQLVRSQFDTLATAALGPMTRAQALADTTLAMVPFDSAAAARMLDSLGWTLPPGKSVRERNGRPLRFAIIVPTVSGNRMSMVVRLQEAYRRMGIEVVIDALEPNTFIARLMKRDFDAAFNGTRAEVSLAGLRPYWSVDGARDPSGRNFSSYRNPLFDAHFDSALSAHEMTEARAHASKAFATIVADAPAIWLYEMRSAPVIHKRVRTAHMLPGAWWAGLADWSIPPDERIARDRVGLNVAAR